MSKINGKAFLILTTSLTIPLLLAGCSINTTPSPSPAETVAKEQIENKTVEPVEINVFKADGETFIVPLTNVAVLNIGDTEITEWTQEIAYSEVAMFEQNADGSNVLYNPKLIPLKVGETAVTLINSKTSQIIVFTVQVAE